MELKSIKYSQLLADLGIQQTASGNQIDLESADFRKYLISSCASKIDLESPP